MASDGVYRRRTGLVIGAGASGLCSLRECLQEGLDVVCFEADEDLGGLWRFTPNIAHSSVYKTTVINTSKEMTAFSVFPPPKELACYMHHSQILNYLNQYASQFDLKKHVRFNTRVLNVRPAADYKQTGSYIVRSITGDSKPVEEVFGFVVVCSGHHWKPKQPTFDGHDQFQGIQLHSHSYKDSHGFEDKNVVVVGVGNSGLDLAVELSRASRHVYVSTRRGTWLTSRYPIIQGKWGMPSDFMGTTRPVWSTDWETLSTEMEKQSRRFLRLELYGLQPPHKLLSAHLSVNSEVPNRLLTGTMSVHPNIKQIKPHSVVFDNGKEVPCDAIVYATGYEIGFPFIDATCNAQVTNNQVSLFKFVFPHHLPHPTLSFVGLIQPIGSIVPISEMQARWIALLLSSKISLPSATEMQKDVADKKEKMSKRYVTSERHTIQVDYVPYMDELADLIGCKPPSFEELNKTDPELARKVWFEGVTPYQYRLRGPHSWPGARQAILEAESRLVYALSSGKTSSLAQQISRL